VASTAEWYFAAVILVPVGDSNTICALLQAAARSVFRSSSDAFWEDDPGIMKSLLIVEPKVA
jgi:hypothetical protein